jgi:hypothetical protein
MFRIGQELKEALGQTFFGLELKTRVDFNNTARLLGSFFHSHGNDDEAPVLLQPVGWSELIGNVTKINVMWTAKIKS